MREKTPRTVVAFHTTTDALTMEAYCGANNVPGRLIPLPTIISAGCGMCWSAPDFSSGAVKEAVKSAGVTPAGMYQMLL